MTERREDAYTREDRELRRYHNRAGEFGNAPGGPEDAKRVGPSMGVERQGLAGQWAAVDRDPPREAPLVTVYNDDGMTVLHERDDCTGEQWCSAADPIEIGPADYEEGGEVTYYLAECTVCGAEKASHIEPDVDDFVVRHWSQTGHRVKTWIDTDSSDD